MIEFRLLGPLEVVGGDRRVPLGGAKQRAVLAILLLHRGTPVSLERLIDELWGDRPPDTATTTVQVFVPTLRRLSAGRLPCSRWSWCRCSSGARSDAGGRL